MVGSTCTAVALMFVALTGAGAQQTSPSLQSRANGKQPDEHPTILLLNHATSVLPEDASGLYRLSEPGAAIGEGLQVDEEFGDITGYLTIKSGSGRAAIGAYFLSHIEGGGGDLNFTTKAVHGLSYSFTGKLVRGPGLTRAQDGFYLLEGDLTMHDDQQTAAPRKVSMKLTGQH